MSKVLNEIGLSYLWSKIKARLDGKAEKGHSHNNASTSAAGFMSAADKEKLDGITSGAKPYEHPTGPGYNHIPSGGSDGQILRWSADGTAAWGSDKDTTYSNATTSSAGLMSAADKSKLDGITGKLGTAAYTDSSAYAESSHSHNAASTSAAGFMSVSDKTKLDGIATGANKYSHPTYTAKTSGLYKVTVDSTGHVSATADVGKSDITALGIPAQDTTYSTMTGATSSAAGKSGLVPAPAAGKQAQYLRGDGTWATPTDTTYSAATASAAGLMSAADKSKLDGITASADSVSFSRSLSSGTKIGTITINGSGTDIYCETNTDTTYSAATTSAAGLMSASDKSKLDGIASGANAYTHPSTHPASMITGLATVAISGSYNDLTNKPNIPEGVVVDSSLSSTSTNAIQNKVVNAALAGKADSSHSHAMSDITGNIDCGTF